MGVDVLSAVLGTLTPHQLAVFQARSERLTFPMIGEMLGISPRAAQHAYERAQANIGKALLPLAYQAIKEGDCSVSDLRLPKPHYSRFRGVTRRKESGKWVAQLRLGKRNVYLGVFDNEVDAARAYDAGVLRLIGSHAVTNTSLGLFGKETNAA